MLIDSLLQIIHLYLPKVPRLLGLPVFLWKKKICHPRRPEEYFCVDLCPVNAVSTYLRGYMFIFICLSWVPQVNSISLISFLQSFVQNLDYSRKIIIIQLLTVHFILSFLYFAISCSIYAFPSCSSCVAKKSLRSQRQERLWPLKVTASAEKMWGLGLGILRSVRLLI